MANNHDFKVKNGLNVTGNITVGGTVDGRNLSSDGSKLDGVSTGAEANPSASSILTSIKTVDGASSGLDSDLLDGQHGTYYTGYTDTAIANLVDSSPGTLNTLNELAAALGDDANFSTTVTNSIATKLPLSGGTITGNLGINKSLNSAVSLSVKANTTATNSYGLEVTNASSNTRFLVDGVGSSYFYKTDNSVGMKFDSSTGNIGVGTQSPSSRMVVYNSTTGGNTTLLVHNDKTGDAAELRLEGKRTTNNDAAQINFANNGNNTAAIRMYSGSDSGELRFYTSAVGSGTSYSEAMRIKNNGDVLFDDDVQAAGLYVGATNTSFDFYNNGTTYLNGATTIDANTSITGKLTLTAGDDDGASPNPALEITHGTVYISHDEATIIFDEGQKMITTNDGNGNFSIIGGADDDGIHVDSASGTSGLARITLDSDGVDGVVYHAVGPRRSGGSAANLTHALRIANNSTTGLTWITGSATYPGSLTSTTSTIFHDNYHPNADAWTTSRTLSLTGDVTGSVSWDGSANASLAATVANDSHTHVFGNITSTSLSSSSDLDGYTVRTLAHWGSSNPSNSPAAYGAMFVIPDGSQPQQLVQTYGGAAQRVSLYGRRKTGSTWDTSWTQYFSDHYHPNADAWTTSRTLSLSGDASGSVTWDGSANVTLSVSVGDADTVDGIQGASFLRSDANDSFSGALTSTARNNGIFGTYDSYKTDQIWSMGTSFKNHASGTDFGNLYGLAYKHTNNATGGAMASGHQMVWCQNGTGTSAVGTNIWTSGSIIVGGTVDGVDIAARNGVLTTTTNIANAALPKAGGTMTAPLTIDTNTSGMLTLSATSGSPWAIDLQRDDATNSRVFNGGGYWVFEHEPRYYNGGAPQKLYHQAYHPEADTLTTARTINGVSFNGSANITVTDSTKLPLSGGTMTGPLEISTSTNEHLILSGATDPYIRFQEGTTDKAMIQWDDGGFLSFRNQENGKYVFWPTITAAPELVLLRNDTSTTSGEDLGSINFGHTDGTPDFPSQTISELPARIVAEATETTGSGDDGARLRFYTKATNANKETDSIERVRIDQDGTSKFYGDIEINSGGASGSACLQINNSSSGSFNKAIEALNSNLTSGESEQFMMGRALSTKNVADWRFQYSSSGSDSNFMSFGFWGVDDVLKITAGKITTVDGTFNNTSDERLKENIKPIENALSDICQLEGVTFDWKESGAQGQGFIAQQVEPIIPEVVNTDDDTGMKSINYVGLIGHLVEAIKTQQTQIDDLKAEIQSMKS